MSGAQVTQASIDLSDTKAAAASNAEAVYLWFTAAGWIACVQQQVVDEVLGRGVLGVDDGLALQVLDGMDVAAHDDAVPAGGPVHLLVDPRCGAGVLHQLRGEEHHHVQGAPEDVALSGGEGVAGHDRVVDQPQVHLEAVLLEEDAVLVGGEAVVGGHDRQPPDPHVDRELDDLLLRVPRVGGDALDRGQLLRRDVVVLVDGGDALGVGGLDLAELVDVHRALGAAAGGHDVPEVVGGPGHAGQDERDQDQLAECGRPDVRAARSWRSASSNPASRIHAFAGVAPPRPRPRLPRPARRCRRPRRTR